MEYHFPIGSLESVRISGTPTQVWRIAVASRSITMFPMSSLSPLLNHHFPQWKIRQTDCFVDRVSHHFSKFGLVAGFSSWTCRSTSFPEDPAALLSCGRWAEKNLLRPWKKLLQPSRIRDLTDLTIKNSELTFNQPKYRLDHLELGIFSSTSGVTLQKIGFNHVLTW